MTHTFTVILHTPEGNPPSGHPGPDVTAYQIAHNCNVANIRGRTWVYAEGLCPGTQCGWCDEMRRLMVNGDSLELSTPRFFLLKTS